MDYLIRNYTPTDLSNLVSFMNANHEFDQFTEGLLKEKIEGDPHWDPGKSLVCMDGGRIIGFMMGVVREVQNKRFGYIKLMAVDQFFRRRGIATNLYRKLETALEKEKVEAIRFYDAPLNYFMPGIDPRYTPAVCFIQYLGFEKFNEAINMTADLELEEWKTALREEQLGKLGISIIRAREKDLDDVLEFVQTDWALWRHEVKMAFANDVPTIHLAWQKGQVKAFSAYEGNNRGMGWFGPMGTHPDLRGLGIGSVLLKRCLKDMNRMGYRKAIIPWVAPIAFYAHHAKAKIDRVFWRFEKRLVQNAEI